MTKNKIADFIKGIIKKCSGEMYIFRGENMKYPRPVSSGLYRQFCMQGKGKNSPLPIKSKHFSVVSVEKKRLQKAKRHFSLGTQNIDVLTKLQHYGGDTALIDFSRNLHIALYFACKGNYKKHGYLYFYKESQFGEPIGNIEYKAGDENKDRLVLPTDKNARVVFQSSVFVHSYRGFLNAEKDKFVRISKDDKNDILDYLGKYFSINSESVYNDIHGFIVNQNSYAADEIKAEVESHRGFASHKRGEWALAIACFDKAIALIPRDGEAYFYRAYAKRENRDLIGAIADFDKAIDLNPKNIRVYRERGIAKRRKGDLTGAIADFDKAIELDSKNVRLYLERGLAKRKRRDIVGAISDFDEGIKISRQNARLYRERGIAKRKGEYIAEALSDFDEAIKLDSKNAVTYNNRGYAKIQDKDINGAMADYDKAIKLDSEYANAYQNRGNARKMNGDKKGAEEDFRRAEELRKKQKEEQEAKEEQEDERE